MYEPFKVFVLLGSVLLLGAASRLGLRYAWFWWLGDIRGHLQSAILSVLLLILGFQTLQWGVMADLIASNRKLHRGPPLPGAQDGAPAARSDRG